MDPEIAYKLLLKFLESRGLEIAQNISRGPIPEYQPLTSEGLACLRKEFDKWWPGQLQEVEYDD